MDTGTRQRVTQEVMSFQCEHCGKDFVREKTLASHLCEPKRRWQDRNTVPVTLALEAYQRFYRHCQPSQKPRTWQQFADSSYYSAFVKFARYMIDVKCVNTGAFMDWVIRKNIKLDNWCRDTVYEEYLLHHTRHEAVQDALTRAIETAQAWAEENNSQFNHMFRYGNTNKICYHITQGRITAWTLYHSESGQLFLDRLNDEQAAIIYNWIDPSYWQKRFVDYPADAAWVQHMMTEAGF